MSTPGPWHPVIPVEFGKPLEIWGNGKLVCTLPTLESSYSDGNMIATAPELVRVLEDITNHFADVMANYPGVKFKNDVEGIPTIKAARAAILRARI